MKWGWKADILDLVAFYLFNQWRKILGFWKNVNVQKRIDQILIQIHNHANNKNALNTKFQDHKSTFMYVS